MNNPIDCICDFFQFLDAQGLKRNSSTWEKIDHTNIIDEFPMLTEEEIITNVTLGKQVLRSLFKLTTLFLLID